MNCEYSLRIKADAPAHEAEPIFNDFSSFVKKQNSLASNPSCLKSLKHASKAWVRMESEHAAVFGGLWGCVISISFAFIMLVIFTGNLIISLYATITVAIVVLNILSAFAIVGWKLGIIESICITVLVGLSVDYTVHLAHAYVASEERSRFARAQDALTVMGGSIISAALTTCGSAIMLLFCQITPFRVFGMSIALTACSSIFLAIFFFIPLSMVAGPENKAWQLWDVSKERKHPHPQDQDVAKENNALNEDEV